MSTMENFYTRLLVSNSISSLYLESLKRLTQADTEQIVAFKSNVNWDAW